MAKLTLTKSPAHIEVFADTSFRGRMAAGHKLRTGHSLDAVNVSDDGQIWHIVRLCCGETV